MQAFLAEHHCARVARRGELVRPIEFPALVAEDEGGSILGLLSYAPAADGGECEVLTLHVTHQCQGVGTGLLAELERRAARHGWRRLWLVTTNDNVDALRFYLRRGFVLAALHVGAVDLSRAQLKPEIPLVGEYGIRIRDEIELEKTVLG